MTYRSTNKNKYEFPNNSAKNAFLQTMWPLHKHKILTFMTYRRIQSKLLKEEHTTSIAIAEELSIRKERASQDLKYLVERGHMEVDKRYIPYIYKLTERGKEYGEQIWIKWDLYKLDLRDYALKLLHHYDFQHPYSYEHDDMEKENIYEIYSKLIKAKDTIIDDNKLHLDDMKKPLEQNPAPMYMIDDFIEKAIKLKKYNRWDEETFFKYLVLSNIFIYGEPDQNKVAEWKRREEFKDNLELLIKMYELVNK